MKLKNLEQHTVELLLFYGFVACGNSCIAIAYYVVPETGWTENTSLLVIAFFLGALWCVRLLNRRVKERLLKCTVKT